MKKGFNVKRLCIEAVMIALFVVMDYYATVFSVVLGGNIKISLSGFPVILMAVFYGPISGMYVGLIGALVGQMVTFGFTATTLLWILPAGVRGLAMGLLFLAFKKSEKFWVLGAEIVLSSIIVTALNTAVLFIESHIYGYYSFAVVFGSLLIRIVSAVATAIVYTVLIKPIIKTLKNIIRS